MIAARNCGLRFLRQAVTFHKCVQQKRDPARRIQRMDFCSASDSDSSKSKARGSSLKDLPAIQSPFESASEKTKEAYLEMVKLFEERSVKRRNHVEFIYAALRNMEAFGVHTDIEVYKALINVMPKGKFIPQNVYQAEFMHYPKQQQCIIDLLEQMEDNGVIPDYEMEAMLLNVFGKKGHPVRKYWRMMYWMPKFKNLSPWLLPNPVPNETIELAKLAVARMCTVDLQSEVKVFETKEIEESADDTWIVSGMSPDQEELLKKHDTAKALYIEGPFVIWLRNKSINYFILRGDPDRTELKRLDEVEEAIDTDAVDKLKAPIFGQTVVNKAIAEKRSVHQQDDGTIFGICVTGTSSKDSLLSWIRLLERNGNPKLSEIPILFKFKTNIESDLVALSSNLKQIEDKR